MQVMLPFARAEGNNGKAGDKQYLIGLFYSGLYIYDGKSFRPFKTEADPIIKNATLYRGVSSEDGAFALSTTGKGVVIIDQTGKVLKVINREVGLQDESVYGMYFDHRGNLWLALDNGISRIEISSPLTTFGIQSGLTTASLSIKRFEGTLYLGSTNGLLRLNQSNGKFEEIPGIPLTQIFTLAEHDNRLLVANDGLYDVKGGKTSLIRTSNSGDLQMSGLKILNSHPDVLFGGVTFGLAVFTNGKKVSGKKDSSGHWIYRGNIPGITEAVWTFTEDSMNRIWAGTQNSTVFRVTLAFDDQGAPDLKKTGVQKFSIADGLGTGSGPVYMVKGKTYFVADSAIYSFDETKKRFFVDTTFGTFPNGGGKDESYIVEEQSGRVWIRMGKELRMATPEVNGKYSIDKTPFLPIAGGTIAMVYPETNGIVWFCTTDGLIRFDENIKKNYAESYKTLLRHITAGQELLDPSDSLGKGENISYKNNALRFEYAAPFFDQEEKTAFQTWLEGFEPGWSDWGKNAYKEYTNLPPGKYTFHVRANNLFQQIGEPASFSFEVMAPWYRTWLAYALYVLTLGAFVWSFIYFRSKNLLEENRILEEKISTRTGELNKSLTELKSAQAQLIQSEKMASLGELTAGIAHEIKNPLNFINNFAEVNAELLTEMKTEIGKANYAEVSSIADDVIKNELKISHHGKRADSIVRTMASHLRKDKEEKLPTDLSAMAEEYLLLSYHAMRAGNNSFNCDLKTDFSSQLGKVKLIPGDISRVITNIYNNAFYSMAEKMKERGNGYKPVIEVKTKAVNGMAEVEITDNGKGIPAAILNKIYQPFFTTKPSGEGTGLGLSLSYDIIKAHGGRLEVKTEEGDCTSFTILLPLG